jgi:hypothetical protein
LSIRMNRLSLAAALAAFALGACVATEPAAPTRGYVVAGPPPPAVEEQQPTPPSPGAVWVGGYWHWTGAQYTWIIGHWETPPPGAVWTRPRYSSREGAHYYEPGQWHRPGGAPDPRGNPTARAVR